MRALWMLVLMVGCGNGGGARAPQAPPAPQSQARQAPTKELGCEDAVRGASTNIPELKDPKQAQDAYETCVGDKWSLETRQCVASAKDMQGLVACVVPNAGRMQPSPATKLTVTGIEPEKGDADGGTYVRIKGTRFTEDGARNVKVYFGARQGVVVRFASDSELIVEAPGGNPDETVDVVLIFEPGGDIKLSHAFTFAAHR